MRAGGEADENKKEGENKEGIKIFFISMCNP
jgi:hypothetical protein